MKKILIIDDSATLRIQLRNKLESAGYEVVEADDGFAGLDIIRANPDASVIIADINMPSMDGLTMLEVVKEKSLLPGAEKIILTTETSHELKAQGKGAGVRAWFIKPLTGKKINILLEHLKEDVS